MHIKVPALALAASLSIVSGANALELTPYAGVNVKAVFLEDATQSFSGGDNEMEFDSGLGLGVSGGAVINNRFRLEGEISYRNNDIDRDPLGPGGTNSGEARSMAYMVNGYYDVKNNSRFTPYIGVGIGAVRIDVEDEPGFNFASDSDTVFGYQAMVGSSFDINDQHSLYLGYRYLDTQDSEFTDFSGSTYEQEYTLHEIEIGYRLHF